MGVSGGIGLVLALGIVPLAANERTLVTGQSVEQAVAPNVIDERAIALTRGAFVRIQLLQLGADLEELLASGPGGFQRAVDDGRLREAAETLSFVVPESGHYTIGVRSSAGVSGARYRLTLDTHAAGAREDRLLAAEHAFAEGGRERRERAAGFRERAATAFETSAALYGASGDRWGRARALVAAGALCAAAEPLRSEPNCLAGLVEAQEIGDRAHETEALTCLGETYYTLGRYDEALESQENALAVAEESGNRLRAAEALQNLAVFHAARLEMEKAEALYARAIEASRSLGDLEVLANALASMTAVLNEAGDFEAAIDHAEEAVDVYRRSPAMDGQANLLANLTLSRLQLGDFDQAAKVAADCLEVARRRGEPLNETMCTLRRSEVLVEQGELATAVELAGSAVRLARSVGSPRYEAAALAILAQAHQRAGQLPRALEALDEAIAVQHRRNVPPRPLILLSRCRLLVDTNALDAAGAACPEALAAVRSGGGRSAEPLALYLQARLERARGRLADAERLAAEALALIERRRSDLRRSDWREAFAGSFREIDEFYLDLLVDEKEGADLQAAATFEASERSRSRGARDALHEARTGATSLDSKLRARQRLLRVQVAREAEARLRPDRKAAGRGADALAELQEQLDEVERAIRRQEVGTSPLADPVPVTLRQIQDEILDDQTVLLAYSLGAKRSFGWAITRSSVEMRTLPARERVEVARAGSARGLRPSAVGAPAAGSVSALTEAMLDPFRSQIERRRLLVIPDGALHHLPFAVLSDPAGGYLLERHEIVHLPSASAARLLRQESPSSPTRSVAVFADPVFSPLDERIARAGTRVDRASARRPAVASAPGLRRSCGARPSSVHPPRGPRHLCARRPGRNDDRARLRGQPRHDPPDAARRLPLRALRHARLRQREPARAFGHRPVPLRRAGAESGRFPDGSRRAQPAPVRRGRCPVGLPDGARTRCCRRGHDRPRAGVPLRRCASRRGDLVGRRRRRDLSAHGPLLRGHAGQAAFDSGGCSARGAGARSRASRVERSPTTGPPFTLQGDWN